MCCMIIPDRVAHCLLHPMREEASIGNRPMISEAFANAYMRHPSSANRIHRMTLSWPVQ